MAQKFIQTNKVLNKLLHSSSNLNAITAQQNGAGASTSAQASSQMGDLEKLEKKHFDKVYKLAEKVLKYCQSDKMNLTNSPPYIIDIVQDICNNLIQIFNIYENKMHILNEIDYFIIFIFNLIDKFTKLIDLFKHSGKVIYDETSNERKLLIKSSLTFSHISTELKSLFPNNVYDGQNFRIAKSDAAEFWKQNFNTRVIVPWNEFQIKLNRVHQILGEVEERDIRRHLQLTGTRYVSIFEFDVFTRLFQPWNTLLNNWKFLTCTHPGYAAFTTYEDVIRRLQNHNDKPGSYLFRLSCTKLGQWAIGYVTSDRKILQTIPQSLVQALIDGEKQGLYVYPDGRVVHIDIKSQMAISAAERITISKEQYDMYCDMGTSFQLCKICSENNKDRKLEPCGHFICSSCLNAWQEKNGINASCPFCRCEIKAFEPIIINPFQSDSRSNSISQASGGGAAADVSASSSQFEDVDSLSLSRSMNASPFEATKSKIFSINPTHDEPLLNLSTTDTFDTASLNSSLQARPVSNIARVKQQLFAQTQSNKSTPNLINFNNELDDESDFDLDGYLKPQGKLKQSENLIVDTDNLSINSTNSQQYQLPSTSSASLTSPLSSTTTPTNRKTSVLSNLQVPLIPPPSLPTQSSSLIAPPHMPPPQLQHPQLPPLPPLPSQTFQQQQPQSKIIQLKIENEKLLEQLCELGYDYTKSACALHLANYNLDNAIEILTTYASS